MRCRAISRKPGLGVTAFDEPIDHLFHLAAVYDVEADEEASERANVEGTKHVIEFANGHEVGRFHHVSSIAVAGEYRGVFQEDMFDEGQRLPHHYHRTKYESERLVREGVEAKTLVYRPGLVVGHSETGEMDKIDGPYYYFKLLQKLRHALPEWFPLAGPEGGETNIVPVDFVAKAMDHIAHLGDDELPSDTFHLVNPEPMTRRRGAQRVRQGRACARSSPCGSIRTWRTRFRSPCARGSWRFRPSSRIREQILRDLGVPPAAMELRDFQLQVRRPRRPAGAERHRHRRAASVELRAAASGTTGSATSTRTSSASARWRARSAARRS